MKQLIVYIIIGMLIYSCENTIENPKFKNENVINILNDTIKPLYNKNDPWVNVGQYSLDIDNDKVIDMVFTVKNKSLGRTTTMFTQVETKKKFSIATQKAYKTYFFGDIYNNFSIKDSFLIDIPYSFKLNDTLSENITFLNDTIDIAYSYIDRYTSNITINNLDNWVGQIDKYIGFKNNDYNIFGWIKLSIIGYDIIILKSYMYTNKDSLFIINE